MVGYTSGQWSVIAVRLTENAFVSLCRLSDAKHMYTRTLGLAQVKFHVVFDHRHITITMIFISNKYRQRSPAVTTRKKNPKSSNPIHVF